eukprot:7156358-Prymnesium_polylepis.1
MASVAERSMIGTWQRKPHCRSLRTDLRKVRPRPQRSCSNTAEAARSIGQELVESVANSLNVTHIRRCCDTRQRVHRPGEHLLYGEAAAARVAQMYDALTQAMEELASHELRTPSILHGAGWPRVARGMNSDDLVNNGEDLVVRRLVQLFWCHLTCGRWRWAGELATIVQVERAARHAPRATGTVAYVTLVSCPLRSPSSVPSMVHSSPPSDECAMRTAEERSERRRSDDFAER